MNKLNGCVNKVTFCISRSCVLYARLTQFNINLHEMCYPSNILNICIMYTYRYVEAAVIARAPFHQPLRYENKSLNTNQSKLPRSPGVSPEAFVIQ